ncbi:MAG: hypothetical protein Q4P72_03470 [Eubacteriales bacterium]|nr:hypothetical protein [Eubacteriales bacterium]
MKKTFQSGIVVAISLILSIFTWLPNLVRAAESEVGYYKVYNQTWDVEVLVKDGIDVQGESLTSFLTGFTASERESIRIEEIGGNDLYCGTEIGCHKVYNPTWDVDVMVKNGIDVQGESLTSFLAGFPASERESIRIEEIGGNDPDESPVNESKSNSSDKRPSGISTLFCTEDIINSSSTSKPIFLISLAKGMTGTLGSAMTISDKIDISGTTEAEYLDLVKAKLRSSYGELFSHTISPRYQVSGPPEYSPQNSRSYYASILKDVGSYNC